MDGDEDGGDDGGNGGGEGDGGGHVTGDDMGGVAQRAGEIGRRLADQIGLCDAGKEIAQVLDPAVLGPASGDPETGRIRHQRLAGGVGIGRLGVVDEPHGTEAADGLHPVGQAGEGHQALDRGLVRHTQRAGGGIGEGGVLGIVAARQGKGRSQVGDEDAVRIEPSARGIDDDEAPGLEGGSPVRQPGGDIGDRNAP